MVQMFTASEKKLKLRRKGVDFNFLSSGMLCVSTCTELPKCGKSITKEIGRSCSEGDRLEQEEDLSSTKMKRKVM